MTREVLESPYSKFFETKSEAELEELSKVKRLLECHAGDPEFRQMIKTKKVSLKQLAMNRGIELENIDSLKPLIDPDFYHFSEDATLDTWPLTAKWKEFHSTILNSLSFFQVAGGSQGSFPEFDEWRKKQIVRTLMDVGSPAAFITHPPVAFELSDGCSVGCWFCGISAKKFGGHFELDEFGRLEWDSTLEAVGKVLDKGMASGFCYWATEPLDHPNYDEFITVYKDKVGAIPQTTTAIPLRNVDLTRKVMNIWHESKYLPNRFSVLSTGEMKKIHAEFTPRELLGVELIMQGKGSISPKSIAGKAIEGSKKRRSSEKMQDGTIACVTGFLVNLVHKTVRLVSPTIPTEEWPDGYYVFSEHTYEKPEQLSELMRMMVHEQVEREISADQEIKLSSKFWIDEIGDKTTIRDDKFGISMEIFNVMVPLLKSGKKTPNEIVKHAVKDGFDPLVAIKVMNELMLYGVAGDSLRPA